MPIRPANRDSSARPSDERADLDEGERGFGAARRRSMRRSEACQSRRSGHASRLSPSTGADARRSRRRRAVGTRDPEPGTTSSLADDRDDRRSRSSCGTSPSPIVRRRRGRSASSVDPFDGQTLDLLLDRLRPLRLTWLVPSSSDSVRVSARTRHLHRARVGVVGVVHDDVAAAVVVDEHADVVAVLGREVVLDPDARQRCFSHLGHGSSLACERVGAAPGSASSCHRYSR